jgi:hypothetical protein
MFGKRGAGLFTQYALAVKVIAIEAGLAGSLITGNGPSFSADRPDGAVPNAAGDM